MNDTSLPTYPDFDTIDIRHKEDIEKIVAKHEPYSDFNFTSLFCWNTDGNTAVALLNGNLVVRQKDYTSSHVNYSLLGSNKVKESLDTLLNDVGCIHLVPQDLVDVIDNTESYDIIEEPDHFDYVYSLDELARLEGGVYKKKRNKVNNYSSDRAEQTEILTLDTISEGLREEIDGLFVQWCFENEKLYAEVEDEADAIHRAVDNFEELGLLIIELRIDGKLKGFSINQKIDDTYAICHFEKSIKAHNSLSPFFVNAVSAELLKRDCRLVNWEQDLGIEGLRQQKRSYAPTKQLKKYAISNIS